MRRILDALYEWLEWHLHKHQWVDEHGYKMLTTRDGVKMHVGEHYIQKCSVPGCNQRRSQLFLNPRG